MKKEQNNELAEAEQEEQLAESNDQPARNLEQFRYYASLCQGAKAEIVIVEDEEDIRGIPKAQLSSDFKIRTYPNGKVALNEILKNKPDLVISDIMMPEMDGTTLCAKLKSNINTNDVPIILLTAKSREEDQLEGLQTGADAYIRSRSTWTFCTATSSTCSPCAALCAISLRAMKARITR